MTDADANAQCADRAGGHAGLRLGKYTRLPKHTPICLTADARGNHEKWSTYAGKQFDAVAQMVQVPGGYNRAFIRWFDALLALPHPPVHGAYTVNGRMIVGIGQESVLENSIALNRLWGVPFIPGSSLKGLARHYASWLASQEAGRAPFDAEVVDALFGTQSDAGLVTFHDAWYIPPVSPADARPLQRDVITGHHGDWYEGKSLTRPREWYVDRGLAVPADRSMEVPPWDFTDPVPVPLLSAAGSYLIVVSEDPGIPPEDRGGWQRSAMTILTEALRHWGIGAKTNAGYGRLLRDDPRLEAIAGIRVALAQQKPDAEPVDLVAALLHEIASSDGRDNQEPNRWVTRWRDLADEAKVDVGAAIVAAWRRQDRYDRLVHGKPGATKSQDKPKGYALELVGWLREHGADE